jgi:6-phosphogluconolactonase
MSASALRWHVRERRDIERLVRDEIARCAAQAIATRTAFSIVLSGGSTPRRLYASLVELPAPSWTSWHVYFSDERCLPRGDPGRNDTMARELFLDRVRIPHEQIHSIPAELGPDEGALSYCAALKGIGLFDLVLLGLGEDGHTASLFPGHALGAEHDAPDALPVHSAPKPPAERVSLSAARLASSTGVFVLVAGKSKRNAIRVLRAGEATVLNAIRPPNGIDVFADSESCRMPKTPKSRP